MKKLLLPIILAIGILLGLVACKESNIKNSNEFFSDEIDNMSYQALSSIKLLESKTEIKNAKRAQNLSNTNDVEVTEKEVIDRYLEMMNELLDTNGGFSSKTLVSDKVEYQNLVEITTKNLQGELTTYSLYYNETSVKQEIDDDDDEVEITKTIEGIAIVGGTEYKLVGKIEEESERDETENESYFKIIEDERNYVIVKEEVEQEFNEYEHEYKYEVITNGVKTNSVSFELEKENGKLKIKMKESSNTKTSYEFKIEEVDNVKYIKIKVLEGKTQKNIRVRVVYDITTSTYTYEYKYI